MEQLFEASIVVITLLLFVLWLLKQLLDRRQLDLETARREMSELQLEHERDHERLAALTSATSDGLILLDGEARVVFMNEAARSLFGVSEGVGFRLDELGWAHGLQTVVDQALQYGEPLADTLVKGERTFAARVRPLVRGSNGGVLIGLNEITQLQRLGRARSEFVANISHELRTPITSLQLLAETLSSEETLTDKTLALDLLDKLRVQIDLLHQLTNELMDLALIESGQAPIKLVPVNANELADQAREGLQAQAERKGIALTVAVPPDLAILADPEGIRKVLANLIHNAIKFTPAGGRIEVRAAPHGENVEFTVEDTGCGIPAKELERIFERFYKVDRARSRGQGELRGTGLGLAIAKHMVEGHGGRIWAESQEGKGSSFHFTVPSANG